MTNKTKIVLGLVVAAGIGYYLLKRKKDSKSEPKSLAAGHPRCNKGGGLATNKPCIIGKGATQY